MSTYKLIVNGSPREVEADSKTKLLWVLRDTLGLTGTKFGCGISECGACSVHINGESMRSC
ncbi:MAG: 2Fe-2S iron-sulfur cluster binding domain-containing protein [Pedosphaera sp.]|nr:2Fe-2S iron-sulfur cluster binding domain-containing protein [Pedosphaera sp.]